MTKKQIKKAIRALTWEPWLERPFGAFILSIFQKGASRSIIKKTGVNADYRAFVFERGSWYASAELNRLFDQEVADYLEQGGSIFAVVKSCQKFFRTSQQIIKKLLTSRGYIKTKARVVYNILALATSYIWLAHSFEAIYKKILDEKVPKYIKGDIEKFIGDMSFPSKKNAHALMEEALIQGKALEIIRKKFAWIKARDGFADGFTLQELAEMRQTLRHNKPKLYYRLVIPKPLRKLAREVQELVYFRTLRSDVFYELLYLARPIISDLGKKYNLSFYDLKDYSLTDLIDGKPKKYSSPVNAACYHGQLVFFDRPIIPLRELVTKEVRGAIAFKGLARGKAKIVKTISELDKVKVGDILVTQMTFPSFIMAMKRAAAFVTDEGGITCHAAIVAREMRKPCVIGTKIATRVLRDGDLVEVDAERGVVRLIKKAK